MTNDLKNFLEEERGGVLTIGDRILVNKVLDLVEKEVENYIDGKQLQNEFKSELSTIINNLRV